MNENNDNVDGGTNGHGAEGGKDGDGDSFDLGVIIAQAQQVITRPSDFYRGMARSGGYSTPVIFLLVMALALGVILAALSFVGIGRFGAMAVGLGSIIAIPIGALIASFVGSAIMFVVWRLMGSGESYQTAYRCVAYASAIYPIVGVANLIPYVGSIIGVVWGMFLMVAASVEVHGRKRETAYLVFGILGLILVLGNVNNERRAREMGERLEEFGESFENLEDMTPAEAGQALGEFLRGLEEELSEEE